MKFTELKNKIIKDYQFRTILFSFCSFIASIAFVIYNGFLGICYHLLFYGSIAVYYLLLMLIRLIVIYSEIHWVEQSDEFKKIHRLKIYKLVYVLLMVLNLALVVPVSLMVLDQRPVLMTLIPAIAMAAYTTFKIIAASINYKKTRRSQQLSIKLLRTINLIDVLVSILTLQNTLIVVNGGGQDHDMFILSSITSLVIIIGIVILTIISFVRGLRVNKSII